MHALLQTDPLLDASNDLDLEHIREYGSTQPSGLTFLARVEIRLRLLPLLQVSLSILDTLLHRLEVGIAREFEVADDFLTRDVIALGRCMNRCRRHRQVI